MSSNHDSHDASAGDGHDAHAADHGVADEGPPTGSSEPRTPLGSLVWPGLIALLVLGLVWGYVTPAFGRFASGYDPTGGPTPTGGTAAGNGTPAVVATQAATTPGAGSGNSSIGTVIPLPTDALTAVPTTVQGGGEGPPTAAATGTPVPPAQTATVAAPAPTTPPASPTPAATPSPAAARVPTDAEVQSGTPRTVTFGGKDFRVAISNTTVPDWPFSKEPGVANWISGTVINYVLGLSYSPENAQLFASVHPSDTVKLARADGTVYTFVVDRVRRVAPTDTTALAQDHPAITMLLLGDPASDRAIVQGHYLEVASR